ncbi:MAG: hypothetical protein QGG48_03465 [Desulfatiglandales bacterium]|nr:hypothetical protein [Desulfatiglandales bacterium]
MKKIILVILFSRLLIGPSMRLSLSAYIVPFAFIYNPSLLFEGPLLKITAAAIVALAGISMISFGHEGYLF